MIGQMAISIAFPGFNDLERMVTPVFLLMGHFSRFSAFSEKVKKIFQLEVWIFWQNVQSNAVLFSSSFIGATVSNAFWRIKSCENIGKISNYLCNRATTTKYDEDKPLYLQTMLNYVRQFFKIRVVFHTLYIWNEDGDPNFFCSHFWQK